MILVVLLLNLSTPSGFIHGYLHRLGNFIGVKNDATIDVTGGPAHGLNK
ncbi:hypothetical protein SDC9_192776 [bioreactor metagenome]|uniref:Uncharacterized protein n=1 Tax=bioreactor metagenome TaxID=1076179 RepID=A0A645I429_9ZZZZ